MRHINILGEAIIKSHEGCKLRAYLCPAGVWTCGWGTTGADVNAATVWTQEYADSRLRKGLEAAEQCVERSVEVPMSDNEFSALVSFVYNIGCGAFQGSTLLRKLNAGDRTEAQNQFHRWTKSKGKELPGLVTRRAAEAKLFGTPDGQAAS